MRVSTLVVLSAAALAGCGEADVPTPNMVAAPKIAREALHVPAGGYPLDTCVVSGEKLGENGNPHIFMHEGTEVRLCCEKCKETFMADTAKYLAKIKDARAPK